MPETGEGTLAQRTSRQEARRSFQHGVGGLTGRDMRRGVPRPLEEETLLLPEPGSSRKCRNLRLKPPLQKRCRLTQRLP